MSAPSPEALAGIEQAILQRQNGHAIRLCRECTGNGLAEATAAVESIEAKQRHGSPTPLQPGGTPSGVEDAVFRGQKILATMPVEGEDDRS